MVTKQKSGGERESWKCNKGQNEKRSITHGFVEEAGRDTERRQRPQRPSKPNNGPNLFKKHSRRMRDRNYTGVLPRIKHCPEPKFCEHTRSPQPEYATSERYKTRGYEERIPQQRLRKR